MTTGVVSPMDVEFLALIRASVRDFTAASMAGLTAGMRVLDIAPQDHEGARPFVPDGVEVRTLDIDPASGCDFIGDICVTNAQIPDGAFDAILCTEVLEHVRRPFEAVREIGRLLRPGGRVFVTTPFNFRIHGPLPDCWRFTEHGLRELFSDFDVESLAAVETRDRFLMPVHYRVVARKRGGR